ncbi:MAG: signal peptidase I [Erysipelotrichaceae bacterium]|nr:signal peptidase I [Erysipelotrichaceae bacterium]MBQ4343402.1 signal peptidase I [Erysipelotrichaceae bacterium]
MKGKISWKEELIDFGKTLLFSLAAVFLMTTFIAKPVRVNGDSMYPQIKHNQVGFSMVFNKNNIERFDVVVVYIEETDKYLVKRVIGLPHETIRYTDSKLYVNDVLVEENFLDREYVFSQMQNMNFTSDFEIHLGEDEVYLLGDNRPYSRDSRYYGPFSKDEIVSKGLFVLFPFDEIGVK